MPVDGGSGDAEFGGDLGDGVCGAAVFGEFVVHLLDHFESAGDKFRFLAAAKPPSAVPIVAPTSTPAPVPKTLTVEDNFASSDRVVAWPTAPIRSSSCIQ